MKPKDRIVKNQKSVVVAADVSNLGDLGHLAREIKGVPGIGGIKIGFRMAFQDITDIVNFIKSIYDPVLIPIIYDHQKAGNDIPAMGKGFAEDLAKAGVTAVIIFPFAGPTTQEVWTKSCFDAGLQVLTGGIMTHEKFLVSEGGYIADDAPEKIFRQACQLGVRHFVVPGTKLEWVKKLRAILVEELGEGNFVLYAPGFIDQLGSISECAKIAGEEWHAIVGSAIYKAENVREAAITVTQQITQ